MVRLFSSLAEAEEADLREWLALSGDERLWIGEKMREDAFRIAARRAAGRPRDLADVDVLARIARKRARRRPRR